MTTLAAVLAFAALLLVALRAFARWLTRRDRHDPNPDGATEIVEANTQAEIDAQLREAEGRRVGHRSSARAREVITRADADWYNRGAAGTNVEFMREDGKE